MKQARAAGRLQDPSAKLRKDAGIIEGCCYLQDVSPRNSLAPNGTWKYTASQIKGLSWALAQISTALLHTPGSVSVFPTY